MKVAIVQARAASSGGEALVSLDGPRAQSLSGYASPAPLQAFSHVDMAAPEHGLAALLCDWGSGDKTRRASIARSVVRIVGDPSLALDAPLLERARVLVAGSRRFPEAPDSAGPRVAMLKFRGAFAAPDSLIRLPDLSENWDVDAVLGVVLGRPAFRASASQAAEAIVGFTLIADVTDRDRFTIESTTNNGLLAKNHPRVSSIGPTIWLPEAPGQQPGEIELRVNGEVRQRFKPDDLVWTAADMVGTWSAATVLPGDVVGLGPAILRQGPAKMPPAAIRPGDSIEVSCAEIGVLRLSVSIERNRGL